MPFTVVTMPPSLTTNSADFESAVEANLTSLHEFSLDMNDFAASLNNYSITSVSSTNQAIQTGLISITVEAGKSFQTGMSVKIVNTANFSRWMAGDVSSYNSGTGVLAVNVRLASSSGTFNSWNVFPASPVIENDYAGYDVGGSSDVLVVNVPFSYTDKAKLLVIKNNSANLSSAPTLNVNSLGGKALYDEAGMPLQVGALRPKQAFWAVYDTSLNSGSGGFRCVGVRASETKMFRDTGTANAMLINDQSWFTYSDGKTICITKANVANTNVTVTLNINGLGAALVVDSTGANLAIGALKANMTFTAMFDATLFAGAGAFKVLEI